MTTNPSQWILRIRTCPAPLQLFCFPPLGGGASRFSSWPDHFAGVARILPLQPPGRENRLGEPACGSFGELVASATDAVAEAIEGPFALFGHSMGALLAYEVTHSLRSRMGLPAPEVLLVSGHAAPQISGSPMEGWEDSEQDPFRAIVKLGGIPTAILNDEEATRIVRTSILADWRVRRSYVFKPTIPLSLRIAAYGGREDPLIDQEGLLAWKDLTTGGFRSRFLPGGHHYSSQGIIELLAGIRDELTKTHAT